MNVSTVQNWYAGLAPREQRVVAIGAVAAFVLLLLAVVLPLHRKGVGLEQRIATKRADLAWMQAVAPTLMAAGPAPAAANNPHESLVVLVDRTARESGLAQSLTGSQPSGDGGLRVQLEKAPFNSLVAWIARLAEQSGVRVESASVDAAGEPGLVNAGVVLRDH
jgi:type II secretory pathway component PulM